jgi:S1-C subfamily serine protease
VELIVDLVLVLLALLAVWSGWRRGALLSAGSLVGLVAGFWVGITIAPPMVGWLASVGWGSAGWRLAIASAIVIICTMVVNWIARAIVGRIRRVVRKGPVRAVDGAGGAALGLLTWGAIVWLLAGFLTTTGVAPVTQAVSSSKIIAGLDQVSPVPVDQALGALDGVLGNAGLPEVFADGAEIIKGTQPPDPDIPAAVTAQSGGVVKILANEPTCNTSSEGSGWVVAPGRVMTNAHVVAGASSISIQPGGVGRIYSGKLVVFDPERDLAVIAVPGLTIAPLTIGPQLVGGDSAVIAGYPENSTYNVGAARVRDVVQATGTDIYRKNTVTRQIYSLRGIVRPGNSGGALFNDQGQVVGVVFARSTVNDDTGYALTAGEIAPIVAQAGATAQVSSGACSAE